ncbi:MAG: hypothetical protein ABI488_26585 [Polyangiaceae bacterium]
MSIDRGDSRLWPGLALLATCGLLTNCVDAQARFEDFQSRAEPTAPDAGDAAGAGNGSEDGPCAPPDAGVVGGPALLAIGTSLIPGLPILFLGKIDTPAVDGTTAVHFVYTALDSKDRSTRVGEQLEVGPFPLDQGLLTAPVPKSTLDGRANPIYYGSEIESEMILTGRICGVRSFYCGTLTGTTSGLLSGPFTGTFGITLLSGPDAVPAEPRFGCGEQDVAPAL